MSTLTVEEIMRGIASTVNQEASAPTFGSSEWNLWLQYLNRSYTEWSEAHDWDSLRFNYFPTITSEGASVSMPANFHKLAASPVIYGSIDRGELVPEIDVNDVDTQSLSSKYVVTVGNHATGFTIVFNPPTLSSGASVKIPYYASPEPLVSLLQVPITHDPQYLVDRTIAFILEARSDPRFQIQENKARERLLTMVENANVSRYNSYAGSNPVRTTLNRLGFRVGRN
jgi:hypothetical protein